MEDIIKDMLAALTKFDTAGLDNLSKSLQGYNQTAFDAVNSLHDTAVKPVASVIIAIVLVLELARNATHIEGDQQMGVKIIAGTMFKSALLVIAAQKSMLILQAINEVATSIIGGISKVDDPAPSLPEGVSDEISGADGVDQAGMLMLLIIPFLIALAAKLVVQVMVILRFAEMYMLTAFASLPVAFLGHPDTKGMGISYLQRYAAVALHGATLMLATNMYATLVDSSIGAIEGIADDQSLSSWIVSQYPNFLLYPIMLIMLVLASGRLAKALVGQ
ncbi:type IV secretion system protein [Actinomyces howellii]|uniref:TrbL/VirB6 plasmid conjugal transfer protein n=1 Tax=Actinomyces howellii TaxID=52771 RepID=A0A3S4RWY2_9ACTO|nr:type IV secretion system protein [Actinomyces howellii]VEG28528.1 Uncharacterised protein [Actinomyces howellii]